MSEEGSHFGYDFPGSSALYHTMPSLIVSRDRLALQVKYLYADYENDRNLKIQNKDRLKTFLLSRIVHAYGNRIREHNMNLIPITKEMEDIFELKLMKFISSSIDEESDDHSGKYQIYPKSFVCTICNNTKLLTYKQFKDFNTDKCVRKGCNGKYEQIKLLFFCKDCGTIRPAGFRCDQDYKHEIMLQRPNKDSLITWRFKCQECAKSKLVDVLSFPCSHKDMGGTELLKDAKKGKFKPMTVIEGAIFLPVTCTTIDIPSSAGIEIEDLEYILIGLYLGNFEILKSRRAPKINLKSLRDLVLNYKNKIAR